VQFSFVPLSQRRSRFPFKLFDFLPFTKGSFSTFPAHLVISSQAFVRSWRNRFPERLFLCSFPSRLCTLFCQQIISNFFYKYSGFSDDRSFENFLPRTFPFSHDADGSISTRCACHYCESLMGSCASTFSSLIHFFFFGGLVPLWVLTSL